MKLLRVSRKGEPGEYVSLDGRFKFRRVVSHQRETGRFRCWQFLALGIWKGDFATLRDAKERAGWYLEEANR